MIKKYQNSKILINAGVTIFETTKHSIKNCKFDNILKDILKKESFTPGEESSPIFVDFESHYFEAILEIMRYFHYPTEEYSKINILNEHQRYNQIEDYNPATFLESRKVFRVYENVLDKDEEGFVENVKIFFKGNELVLKEAGLLKPAKNKVEQISVNNQVILAANINLNHYDEYSEPGRYDENPYQY
jgi:hypothetical protein